MPSAKDRRKKQDKRAGEGTADGKRTAEAHSQGFPIRNAPAGRQNPVYDQKWKEDVNKAEVFSHPDGTDPEHDPGNTTQEDTIIHNVTASGQFQSTFPCRPAYRTWAGGKVNSNKVWANYFRLNLGKGITIHRYGISVEPDRDGKKPKGKTMKRIVEILLELPEFTDVKQSLVTDFSTLLISPEPINASELPSLNSTIRRTIHYRREGDDLPRQQDRQFHLQIERLSALNTIDLQRPWDSNDLDQTIATQKAEILQCLNIIFGHYIKTHDGLVSVGSQKGYIINQSKQEHELGAGLVALRGFFSSVRIATSQVLLNVNVSNAAFYKAVGLDELMKLYIGVHGSNIEKLEAFLKGLRVTAEHLPEKDRDGHRLSRVKTIFSLAREEDVRFVLKSPDNPSSSGGESKGKAKQTDTFDPSKVRRDAQGRVGVFDFFRAKYHKTLTAKDKELPVVNVGNKEKPCYIPAQVCTVIAGQAARTKLSANQTTQMIEFAVREPYKNAISIVKNSPQTLGLLRHLNTKLDSFHLTVDPRLIKVPAHTLVSPNIQYNNRDIKTPDRAGDWNLTNTKFHTVMPVAAGQSPLHWACLNITDISEPNEHLIPSLNQFTEVLRHTGINIRKPQYLKSMTVNEPMDRYFNEICGIKGIQILLVLIPPENNTAIYNRVKVLGDIEKSLHTVCVKASDDKFFSQSPSYYANVALKFNLKLRGVNHVIDSKIDGSETMVVGIDVTHPSPGSEGAPSIAAMVASIDKEFAQWPVDLRIQRAWNEMKKDEKSAQDGARQEMVSDIYEMLRSRLKLWQNRHKGTLPKNILIYRDGVSESQYQQVLSIELTAMKRACADTYGKQQPPKITIIIVGKRHHTRFFPTLSHQADSSHNTPRGTLVDRTLFSAPSWEFFLQSHTALQGTVRPAHYVVIYDEIFRAGKVLPYCCSNAAEWLEAVTNDLCFLFGRATKAVSIPAPVYYADVACGRARRWLGEVFVGEGGGGKRELGYGELQRRITPEGRLRDEMFYV